MKSFVINLERRADRKENVKAAFDAVNFKNYEFYKAVDGKELKGDEYIYNLFYGNDFNWRKGVIGCALSHYNLWKQLAEEPGDEMYCIFEDDFNIRPDFLNNLNSSEIYMQENKTDILFMGYTMFRHTRASNKIYDSFQPLQIKDFRDDLYIGGFFGYILSKTGAKKLVEYIDRNGIKHGIDYLIKIDRNLNVKECQPHIIFSDWVDVNTSKVDSDIQKDFDALHFDFPKYQIINLENTTYKYYQGLDSSGYDLRFVGRQSVHNLAKVAANNSLCQAFNSLGFLKHKVDKIGSSPYIGNDDGLYVKMPRKNGKIRVKMICNWCTSLQLCEEWNHMSQGNYTWNNIEITAGDDADYFVIINKPLSNEFFIPEKTIVFQMEPWCYSEKQNWGVKTWGEWAKPNPNKFLQVRSHDKFVNNGMWQLKTSYTEFKKMEIVKEKKYGNIISTICSSKYFDPGHIKRIDFLKYVEKRGDSSVIIHVYNHDNQHNFRNYQGPHPPGNKDVGIMPYKYYFMGENNEEKNFVTEKMYEPLLTESLCFYWGCPNISEIINPLAYVVLDLSDFEKSFNLIKNAIENNLWEERREIIKQEKQRVLDYYNFFPTIERVIYEDINVFDKDVKVEKICFIHSCNMEKSGTKVLDELYTEIKESGLLDELDYLVVNNIGINLDKNHFGDTSGKVKIINYSTETNLFEIPTIMKIIQFSKTHPNCKLLYLHTKGISHSADSAPVTEWRRYLSYFMVSKYQECLAKLNDHDAVGCNYTVEPHPHYSGNFWWANTNYINTINNPLMEKYDAEWWILSASKNFYTMHNSNVNHYHNSYPREKYVS